MDDFEGTCIIIFIACVFAQNAQALLCIHIAKSIEKPFESLDIKTFLARDRSRAHQWLRNLMTSHPMPHIRTRAAWALYIDIVSRVLAFVIIGVVIVYAVFCT